MVESLMPSGDGTWNMIGIGGAEAVYHANCFNHRVVILLAWLMLVFV